jgi:alkanesulfonate monooxygenase SsuD/methylene tetrahydromethanopterin reductase-like flavin-dependent oxidoreductase (luciferase family)
MRYGLTIPNFGDTWHPRTLAGRACEAEDAGWDGFFLWDHVYLGAMPHADPWIALAAIALATERIKLGPMVTPIPRRNIVKLARETVTLDHLSNGRLIFGAGIGLGSWEWRMLGMDIDNKTRGAMLDEALDLLAKLWSGQSVSHHGEFYTVQVDLEGASEPGPFLPASLQSPRIPIWVAGMWPNKPPFRRAARWDGAFPIKAGDPAEGGLQPDDVRALAAYIARYRTSGDPFDIVVAGVTPGGDPAAARAKAAAYADAGATWWLEDIGPWSLGWDQGGAGAVEAIHERIRQGPPR